MMGCIVLCGVVYGVVWCGVCGVVWCGVGRGSEVELCWVEM